jgi:hypothetical protein
MERINESYTSWNEHGRTSEVPHHRSRLAKEDFDQKILTASVTFGLKIADSEKRFKECTE